VGQREELCSKDDGDPPSGIDGERDGLDDMVSRFADQPVVETAAGVTRRSLRHDRVRGVEIAINVYKPRTASAPEPVAHDGCEFGVVLDGILEVTVGGRIHKLQKGDLISYPSTEPHRFANTSSSPARTIWLNLKRDPMQ
jgi:quercetin dioxygenase-like cupin family protein